MMTPRRDEEGHLIHERLDDNGPWGRLAVAIERYRLLWIVAIAASAWLGNRLIAPLNAVTVVANQQTEMLAHVVKTDSVQVDMQTVLAVLVRIQCLQLSPLDRAKLALDCTNIPILTMRAK